MNINVLSLFIMMNMNLEITEKQDAIWYAEYQKPGFQEGVHWKTVSTSLLPKKMELQWIDVFLLTNTQNVIPFQTK